MTDAMTDDTTPWRMTEKAKILLKIDKMSNEQVSPEKDRLKYDYLIKIAVNGTCALTPAFQRAIDNAAQHSQRQ